ncbi:alpha/beta hydrolase [Rhodococcus sovatensis]|uniref:Alpha/beta hydrolase n=1 Tax=Rhodococcus sovatensis TaxID=1805840 RepID=A0ABZ2PIT4_9NOCA
MHIEALDAELAALLGEVPALDFADIAATRAALADPTPSAAASDNAAAFGVTVTDMSVTDMDVEADGHTVRVRVTAPVLAPGHPLPVIVEVHGGGFALGSGASNDDGNRELASTLPCIVVAVDYRLSPEFPYPAAVEDCVAAVTWATNNAGELGGDVSRVGLLGTSAGACLAACTALHLRDRYRRDHRGPIPVMQALIEPALDDRDGTPSMVQGGDAVFWNTRNAMLSWQHYLAGRPADEFTSPSREQDLSGLPPTYLTVNELDPLRDQGIDYARRLLAADVRVEMHCWPGAFHGFRMFDTDLGRRTRAMDVAAIARLMGSS